jgi:RNA polymerase sigma-70 factor (ECF subfamily)
VHLLTDNLNEQELIGRLRQGDEPAFRWLVDTLSSRINYTVLNILQDPDDADDVLQETFIQVYESIGGFRAESSLSTWVHKIAIRKALEKLRKRKTRQRIQSIIPWWMPEERRSADMAQLNPGIAAENKEKASALFKAIDQLPENQKLAFTLIRVQGMKHEEVTEIMGLGIKAVESLLSRAKENLKKNLEKYYNQ